MVDSKLVQVAQYGYTWNFGQVLDRWNVSAIKIFEGSVYYGDEEERKNRRRSQERKNALRRSGLCHGLCEEKMYEIGSIRV